MTAIATWFEAHFITSFRHEAQPQHWPLEPLSGVFAIPQLCLTYCETAAVLVASDGDAGSRRTIKFIETQLGRHGAPSAARYRDRACGLYSLYRHGLVHRRVPGTLALDGGAKLTWFLERPGGREDHLRLYPPGAEWIPGRVLPTDTSALRVGVDLLFHDLLSAFECIRQRLHDEPDLAKRVAVNRELVEGPRLLQGKQTEVRARLASMIASPDA